MLTNSAVHKAPAKLTIPASNQQSRINQGDPNCSAIGAIFLNTPDPIITLMTKKLAALNPNFGCKLFVEVSCTFYFLNFSKTKTWIIINN